MSNCLDREREEYNEKLDQIQSESDVVSVDFFVLYPFLIQLILIHEEIKELHDDEESKIW